MLKDIEVTAERWSEIACPIFGDSTKRYVSAEGFGTGFLASIGAELYFFTAYHVVEAFSRYAVRVANIGGKSFDLDALKFHGDKGLDIAFAKVEKDKLFELGLVTAKHCPLARDWSGWSPLETYVSIGYPATRNQLKLKFNSTDRHCFNLFAKSTSIRVPKSSLRKHIGLSYDPKKIALSDGTHLSPPDLQGMSGGPCFQLMSQHTSESVSYSFMLRGLVSEFHPKQKVITVSPIDSLLGIDY